MTQTQAAPAAAGNPLQPPAIFLQGESGSGKTYSLSTLLAAGLEVFVISTEPTGIESLLDVVAEKKLDINKLHWKQITPSRVGFGDMAKMVDKIGAMTYESLTKLPPQGDRRKSKFVEVISTCSNFIDDRTGKAFGPIDSFGPNCAVIVDSLSGLNLMAMDLAVGDKPTAHQGEWGIAMGALEKLITSLSSGLKCYFVLTAHLERETDDLTGGTKLMASALGRKLAPKLPRFFSEVIHVYRDGSNFFWSTNTTNVVTKRRILPLGDKIAPTFQPIVDGYQARLKQISGG